MEDLGGGWLPPRDMDGRCACRWALPRTGQRHL